MAIENNKTGLYQIRRIEVDLRDGSSTQNDAEIKVNTELLELQQNNNVEIIDVTEIIKGGSIYIFLIKYRDNNL